MNTSPAQTLRAHGVHLYVDESTGRMRFRAPAGALTPLLRDQVAEVALQYEERAAIREFDGGMDRATAERMAAADAGVADQSQGGGARGSSQNDFSSGTAYSGIAQKCIGFHAETAGNTP